jgi:hypothetical protein
MLANRLNCAKHPKIGIPASPGSEHRRTECNVFDLSLVEIPHSPLLRSTVDAATLKAETLSQMPCVATIARTRIRPCTNSGALPPPRQVLFEFGLRQNGAL